MTLFFIKPDFLLGWKTFGPWSRHFQPIDRSCEIAAFGPLYRSGPVLITLEYTARFSSKPLLPVVLMNNTVSFRL